MLRYLTLVVAVAVGAGTSSAQVGIRTIPGFGSPALVQSPNPSAQSLPLFLRPADESQAQGSYQRWEKSLIQPRECPMPVHRPDSSRRDRIAIVQLKGTADPGMVAVVNCPNPLDSKTTAGPFVRLDSLSAPRNMGKF